jgi:hypothetical protein
MLREIRSYGGFILIVGVGCCLLSGTAGSRVRANSAAIKTTATNSRRAVWGFDTSFEHATSIDSPLRNIRNKLWDGNSGEGPLSDVSPGTLLTYRQTHIHAFALEVLDESQTVIIGTLRDASSYLSNDRTTVYTELLMKVSRVLHDKSGLSLTDNSIIALERAGGAIHFASGKTLIRGCSAESMPEGGRKYLLVLTYRKAEDIFLINNGFELSNDHVYVLDSVSRATVPRRLARPGTMNVYLLKEYGAPTEAFLDAVKKGLAGDL